MNQEELSVLKTYLSDAEIKEIVLDNFKERVRNFNDKEIHRIFSNICYYFMDSKLNEVFPDNAKEIVAKKVVELFNDDKSYSFVFSQRDSWGRGDSTFVKIVEQSVNDNKDFIKEKSKEIMDKRLNQYENADYQECDLFEFGQIFMKGIVTAIKESK